MDLHELNRQLDLIAARLPIMVHEYPNPADFWTAFAKEADPLFEQAGEHYAHVRGRVDKMLADTGMIPSDG
jgi:hypothetical protein